MGSSAQGGGENVGGYDVSVPISGGAAAPAYSAASITTDVSAPFEESAFDVGGTQYTYPGQPIDSAASSGATASSSALPSWALYAGAAFFVWYMWRHHGFAT
jgi:hypothetical protein